MKVATMRTISPDTVKKLKSEKSAKAANAQTLNRIGFKKLIALRPDKKSGFRKKLSIFLS